MYSIEEDLSFEIWLSINNRINQSCLPINDHSFLNSLNFEIISDFYNKDVLFSYALKEQINIRNIEISLMSIGINKTFKDNNNLDRRRYLAVWK
jgi:hypothetical protein